MGKEKLYELFNEIFRLSGAGVDLNLALKEGEDDSLGQDEIAQMKQTIDQIGQYLQQMAGQLQKNSSDIAEQDALNQQQQEAIKGLNELAQRVKIMSEHVDELHQQGHDVTVKLIESMAYKDLPNSIRRQVEAQAGFKPAFGEDSAAPPTKTATTKTK
jgi:methyl-accepting chemotaxis protein